MSRRQNPKVIAKPVFAVLNRGVQRTVRLLNISALHDLVDGTAGPTPGKGFSGHGLIESFE